jgi:arginase
VRYLPQVAEVCRNLAVRIAGVARAGQLPLVLGGDHSIALGTVAGLVAAHGTGLGLLWVDAHADMNTPETSPSGNIHGMPLAALLGRGHPELTSLGSVLDPRHVVLLGTRDVDPGEAALAEQLGVRVITMSEIDRRGLVACLDEALAIVTASRVGFHLSLDLDAIDPQFAPGVGTPIPGGLNVRESHLVCELAAASGQLRGLEVVELNPTLDLANQTGRLAVWLIQSALGKRIMGGGR